VTSVINDDELNNLEKYIPKLADGAFQKAYLDTLSHGGSVLLVENGKLIKVLADGSKEVIKDTPKSHVMKDQMVLVK